MLKKLNELRSFEVNKNINLKFEKVISLIAVLLLLGCTDDSSKPNIEVIQDMMEQPALKSQDFKGPDGENREKSGMLVPPEGTVPKGFSPYLYKGKPEEAGQKLVNPFKGNKDQAVMELGEKHFKNFCMVCHGEKSQGNGPVAEKFVGVKPPSLLSDKIRGYPDGRIFHIITDGQGIMGAYTYQMPKPEDRWAVVQYVRSLQEKYPQER